MITKDQLREIIEQLEYLESLMEDKGENDIDLACSTYGIHETFLSIPGKGYLPIQRRIDDYEEN